MTNIAELRPDPNAKLLTEILEDVRANPKSFGNLVILNIPDTADYEFDYYISKDIEGARLVGSLEFFKNYLMIEGADW